MVQSKSNIHYDNQSNQLQHRLQSPLHIVSVNRANTRMVNVGHISAILQARKMRARSIVQCLQPPVGSILWDVSVLACKTRSTRQNVFVRLDLGYTDIYRALRKWGDGKESSDIRCLGVYLRKGGSVYVL